MLGWGGAGGTAKPVVIGPGTISASVVIGKRLDPFPACAAVLIATVVCLTTMTLLTILHDYVRPRHKSLIQRCIKIAGRITALYAGTVAVDMIMQGARAWTVSLRVRISQWGVLVHRFLSNHAYIDWDPRFCQPSPHFDWFGAVVDELMRRANEIQSLLAMRYAVRAERQLGNRGN